MKPLPPPRVPGNTDAERMDNAVRKLFTVSKEDYLKEEARLKRTRERRKRPKAAHSDEGDHYSDLMAISIPSDADHRRSEATLSYSYHP